VRWGDRNSKTHNQRLKRQEAREQNDIFVRRDSNFVDNSPHLLGGHLTSQKIRGKNIHQDALYIKEQHLANHVCVLPTTHDNITVLISKNIARG
jgi:hypothetical protein